MEAAIDALSWVGMFLTLGICGLILLAVFTPYM